MSYIRTNYCITPKAGKWIGVRDARNLRAQLERGKLEWAV